ncbi:putative 3-deoxy-D-manno-octulosonate cytidylyltransferase [Hyphomonas neptunium ATCC 15444]|uniref:3-deoxy-manno-octulosonate cytidylyltransferase n=2 Tax=Hyphomonas TaxID=85 RepID=A0A059FE43_9PROT|nr:MULTISPECIES: manno-octulosonate cytidylyltransferase [Hyphomonas]ABI77597.1 putative 3-deoxy-D-manno-octulosonate cytidylyltransferase [Hyphomonas neptunium ATCC 15444]KCZ88816.1 3-deoxy-manno-octulosonate cytidylyltransferase [Hyphomonas hirschiana VP5]
MQTLIVVPARYGSTRLPGKPLAKIAGKTMVSRVADLARRAAARLGKGAEFVVATDDTRILQYCRDNNINVVMTDPALPSGSDRALAAVDGLGMSPDFVVNLQGDAPFTPAEHVVAVVEALEKSGTDAATPYIRLSWAALDQLRNHKAQTPFSGTTLVKDPKGRAIWFSKIILPAIRKEPELRKLNDLSPVCQHVGLYGFRLDTLRRYCALPESYYERLEGLEQLRLIENGFSVQAVEVKPGKIAIPGIDTAEDIALAERLVAEFGEPDVA